MKPSTTAADFTKQYSYLLSPELPVPLVSLKIAQKQPSEFATALVHEIRNPLSTIKLALEMLMPTLSVIDDDQKKYIDIIMRSTDRINDLVIDFLAPSQDELQSEKYFIHELLDEGLAMAEDRILLKNISITKDYTDDDCKILMNKKKVKIALSNIIINAIDAMPSKGGQLKLVTKSISDKCVMEIEDNGIGISKENLKNIFTPYFTNKPGGLGLGLATTLDILLSNHVSVEVQSLEGHGTRFILSFNEISDSVVSG